MKTYDSYVPDWTTSSTVSAATGSISVSPATAQLLSGLLDYDELAERSRRCKMTKI